MTVLISNICEPIWLIQTSVFSLGRQSTTVDKQIFPLARYTWMVVRLVPNIGFCDLMLA
jgi:hypothetical protein